MRLSCPNCQTEYDVPDAALAGRARTLRCALCGQQWQAGAIAVQAAPELRPRSIFSSADPIIAIATLPDTGSAALEAMPADRPLPPPMKLVTPPPPAEPGPATTSGRRKIAIPAPEPEEPRKDREALARLAQARLDDDDSPRGRQPNRALLLWLLSLLILAAIILVIWIERDRIMQIWPPSIRLFLAIQRLTGHS